MLRMLRTDGEVSVDIRGIRALGMPRHDKRAE
jgi:hypothetical protein